jgi:hypothetical protein
MSADLYLETGEQSITHAYHIAERAAADGRPLVVLTVADCDPSGYQMSVSIARKLQALRDLRFPSLEADLVHVGLMPDQVRRFELPSSPLSDKDKRKARWIERMGVEQTEVDSLLALHPGALAQMIRDALKPYFDPTLDSRVRRAEWRWRDEARHKIQDGIENDPDLAAERARIEVRADGVAARIAALTIEAQRFARQFETESGRINEAAARLKDEIADVDNEAARLASKIKIDPPDVPGPELPDRPTDGSGMVLSSAWDWVEATRRLKARKAYEDENGDEDEAAE